MRECENEMMRVKNSRLVHQDDEPYVNHHHHKREGEAGKGSPLLWGGVKFNFEMCDDALKINDQVFI